MGWAKYKEDNDSIINNRKFMKGIDPIQKAGNNNIPLNNYVGKNQNRMLPIFILADTSGSMEGEKIFKLNNALREMIHTLSGIEDIRGVFKVCIITFGNNEVIIHQPLEDVNKIKLKELTAAGKTPLGKAIETVINVIEDKTIIPSTAYFPTIVLISDGIPTDINLRRPTKEDFNNWQPIQSISSSENRSSKCLRLAMGIGDDANEDMLRAFIANDSIRIFKANEASEIEAFFHWVTMTTVKRMEAPNPDDFSLIYDVEIDTDDLPIG